MPYEVYAVSKDDKEEKEKFLTDKPYYYILDYIQNCICDIIYFCEDLDTLKGLYEDIKKTRETELLMTKDFHKKYNVKYKENKNISDIFEVKVEIIYSNGKGCKNLKLIESWGRSFITQEKET